MTQRPSLLVTQDPRDIGPFLRQRRIALGMKQKDLAEKLGHTASFIANVEAGRAIPPNSSPVLPATVNLVLWAATLNLHLGFMEIEEK